MLSFRRIRAAFAASAILAAAAFILTKNQDSSSGFRLLSVPAPDSTNPLDFGLGANRVGIAAVRAGLLDAGRKGTITGILAKRWSTSDDFKVWRFEFRSGLRFENGDPIRPSDLAESWFWLASRMREREDDTTVLADLEGYERPDAAGRFPGIEFDELGISLRFTHPQPALLSRLSDPQLALTHSRCRDSTEGRWRCEREAVSSGPYRIVRWTDHELELVLRQDFPSQFRHPNAFRRITVGDSDGFRIDSDAAVGVSAIPPRQPGLQFHGGASFTTGFAYCLSWTHPKSPCQSTRFRRVLRDRFYHHMERAGADFSRSFFPLAVSGIREPALGNGEGDSPVPGLQGPLRVETIHDLPGTPLRLKAGFSGAAKSLAIQLIEVPMESSRFSPQLKSGLDTYDYDVVFMSSSFNADDPESSIRSLFLSRDGARLADPSGRIRKALAKSPIDLPAIDAAISEDAVIWPVGTVSEGLWVRDEVDLSLLNPSAGALPLHWIGRRIY